MQSRQAAADHRRGRRGRGPGHARRQQDPRHVQLGRRQGPGLRRAPQGHAADMAILTGGQVISEEVGLKLDNTTLDLLGTRPQGRHHQGRHHHHRGCRRRRRRQGPHRADQARDRRHRLRLGPREAPGAPGQAVRRRRRRQGRRGHRGGAQGEEAPHRGRPLGDPCRHRGRRRRRWRHRPRSGPAPRSPRPSRRSRATRPPVPASCCRALEAPARLIADNAGLEGAVIVQQVEAESGSIGLNAATGEFVDLLKAGVIDPAKVTRAALQNAASIAALLLTTEALVADKPEEGGADAGHARWHGRHGWHGRHDVRPLRRAPARRAIRSRSSIDGRPSGAGHRRSRTGRVVGQGRERRPVGSPAWTPRSPRRTPSRSWPSGWSGRGARPASRAS